MVKIRGCVNESAGWALAHQINKGGASILRSRATAKDESHTLHLSRINALTHLLINAFTGYQLPIKKGVV